MPQTLPPVLPVLQWTHHRETHSIPYEFPWEAAASSKNNGKGILIQLEH